MSIPKIVVVCGPTATGKTRLGIELAKQYDGEIVSAKTLLDRHHGEVKA